METLRNTSVDVNGTHLEFDSEGNPNIGYNLLQWNRTDSGKIDFIDIGHFEKKLNFSKRLIRWHTKDSKVIPKFTRKVM